MTRRTLVITLLAQAARAQETLEVFAVMAEALSQDNADEFLAPFDRRMPGFDTFARQVRALSSQAEVSSSVELLTDDGDEKRRKIQLDWVLEVKPKTSTPEVERRRKRVTCEIERQGKRWLIVSLSPLELFAPPKI